MKILTFFLTVAVTESAVLFTLSTDGADWDTAKSRCEALGQRLAVLDTEEKLKVLRDQVSASFYSWIGFHDLNDNDEFVWLNGNPLPDDDENWWSDEPHHGSQNCGYITTSYKWTDRWCSWSHGYLCEENVCSPGYYDMGFDCVMCIGNSIKTTRNNATNCDADPVCDGETTVPNENHTACVCNAGYYGNGRSCVKCSGNTTKPTPGDAKNCSVICDGIRNVPNNNRTACVCKPGHKMLDDGSCSRDRSVTYNLAERDVELTSNGLIYLQVVSVMRCGAECAKRNCEGFSFHLLPPDVKMCSMIMGKNGTYQPLQGAEYYTKP